MFKIGDKVVCKYDEFKNIEPGTKGVVINVDSDTIQVHFDNDILTDMWKEEMQLLTEDDITVNFKFDEGATIPFYASHGAAGMDLSANINERMNLRPLERKLVPTGLYFEIPVGYEGQIRPRSGLALKQGITVVNSPGTIDSDYRGELKVLLINLSNEVQYIDPHERIAQIVFARYAKANLFGTNELSITDRNDGGFGSTGN